MDIAGITPNHTSKVLWGAFFGLLTLSVLATFWRVFIAAEYTVVFEARCDPTRERCFVRVCTPDTPDTNPCMNDSAASEEYFVRVAMDAHAMPGCSEENHQCADIRCTPSMNDECQETYCSPEDAALTEGATCSNPATHRPSPARKAPLPTDSTSMTPESPDSNTSPEARGTGLSS